MKFRWRTALAAVGLLSIMGCASKGCSCVQPIPGGFPTAERHESAIQLRATEGLFQYLSQNGASLIPSLLPTGTTFNIPPSCGGSNQICCATPAPMCRINFDFKTLSLTPAAPKTLHLSTDLQLKTLDPLPVTFSGSDCVVTIDTAASGSPTMNVSADIDFSVNATTDDTEIAANNAAVTGIDDGDLTIKGSLFSLCTLAGLPGIKGFVVSQLESQVATQIQNTVSAQACMKCMAKSDCNSFASDCVMGTCVGADGKTCIQELGLDGRMDIGSALASFSPGLQAHMDVLAVLGGYATADTGLSLGMLGGGLADPHSPCVPDVPPPAPVTVPPSTTFTTDVLPDGATPYHLGIGVHVSHLDTLGYAAWNSGALCLDVGTPSVALLSSKTISVVIPSLDDLTHGADAPMFLVIRPQAPPTFTLGKGTFKVDSTGVKTIDDALLHISVPKFDIDFYAFVDERYVRIMTLGADLELPVSLDVDAAGKIVPLLGDLGKAFTNVTVENSELLAEAPADLAKTFPMLLGLAGGQLGSALKPIALPALMGIQLKPLAITSTDPDADGQNQFLSIFADMVNGTPLTIAADTDARLARITLPPREAFAVDARTGQAPSVTLALSGRTVDGLPLEYSYSVDDTGWSPFSETSLLTLTHPLFWLVGAHHIDVRARAVGHPETLDDTPSRVTFDIQPTGPNGFHGRTTSPQMSGCGCQLGGASPSGGALALVSGLLFGLLLLRRRRALLVVLGMCALALTTVGCNSGLGKGDYFANTDEIGRYSDLQVKNGVIYLSAYDDTFGDLAFAQVTDLQKPIGWQYVDGISDGATADQPGGYRHGVSDPGPDVGLYTSLALTKSGAPRISYYDATDQSLRYASGPHPFRVQTIDAGMNGVDVGGFTALSLDANDIPTIAYMATGISDGQSGFRSELRVATASSANPASASDWTISTVDTTRIACGGLCPTGTACIQTAMVNGMPNGDPAQSTCVAVDAAPCPTMCADTQACIMATCTTFVAPVKSPDLPAGTGLFTQALLKPDGTLLLVYYDHSEGDLKLATRKPDGSFDVAFIDGNDPATDVGQFAAARLAQDGTLHVAYQDAIHDSLLYKTVSGGMPLATAEVIDDGVREDGPHPVGGGAALILDGTTPRVVYQDQAVSDLLEAERGSAWMHQELSSGIPGYGFYPRLAQDGGKLYLSQFVYDRENASPPIGALQLSLLPPQS